MGTTSYDLYSNYQKKKTIVKFLCQPIYIRIHVQQSKILLLVLLIMIGVEAAILVVIVIFISDETLFIFRPA